MISKKQYEAGIRCKGICNYGNNIGGGCLDRDLCYQYYKENVDKDDDGLLYKVVKFRGKVFNCTIDINKGIMIVYDVKYDNTFEYPLYSDDLVKECKDAILRVYNINIKSQYVEEFNKWDGTFEGDDF